MKFEQLQRRIQRAEDLLEGRERQVQAQWSTLKRVWRQGWTPLRIVVAGFGLGFVSGRAEPVAALNSMAGKLGGAPKLLQMIATVSGLFTAMQAQEASDQAERAAEGSEDAAQACRDGAPGATAPAQKTTTKKAATRKTSASQAAASRSRTASTTPARKATTMESFGSRRGARTGSR